MLVQIKGIKNELLILRVEDSAEGFLATSVRINVQNVRDQQVACSHQVTNITVCCQKPLLFGNLRLQLVNCVQLA